MATSLKRVYWDACAWIALIQKEKIRDARGVVIEDRETMCKTVISAAKAAKCEIVTSALSFVEVCKSPEVRTEGEDKIAAFFEHEFIIVANLDRYAGERGRELMLMGYAGLKPPDASHVATAAISNADEMHTFDKKLLDLDGMVTKADGTKLKICKPDVGELPPLLQVTTREHVKEPSDDEPSDEGEDDPESEKDSAEAPDDTGARGANPALPTRSG